MRKSKGVILCIILSSLFLFTSCASVSNIEKESPAQKMERLDDYVPWWKTAN